jgi:uncharacterized OB-fold protein
MVKVTELVVCSDCGTAYYPRQSEGYCPHCKSDLREPVTESSGRSLDR